MGFAVLIITFGVFALSIVASMHQLRHDIAAIRLGYLDLAHSGHDLHSTQERIRTYLFDELRPGKTAREVKQDTHRLLLKRGKALSEAERTLTRLSELPQFTRHRTNAISVQLVGLRRSIDQLSPFYKRLTGALGRGQSLDSQEVAAIVHSLREGEAKLIARASEFKKTQIDSVAGSAEELQADEGRLRRYTVYWALGAVGIALLMTLWAGLSLRPLARLRDAAQRIARGDYASRIDSRGPTEIADLAREFNVMGQAIEERERQLVRSERLVAVGKMAATITHEVRNPLSSIGLNTELLQEELAELSNKDTDEALALCRSITAEVNRLTEITEEYLHFARLPQPRLRDEDLNGIVSSVAAFENEQLALRGVRLRVELHKPMPQVCIDERQVRQALLNLLRNAADAVEEIGGGSVSVTTALSATGDAAIFSVADDGPGISDELAPKLFDPFFSAKPGGTGLGLALTHQIITEHGGSIRVDSKPGHGARFIVTLPIVNRDNAA